jgi:AcrR family transcriptional regulator
MSSSGEKVDGRVARAEKKRRERRLQVLDAARVVFAQKGYHATSIADLIEAAGIARGTFYLYFDSKRAIFDELLEHFFALLTHEVKPVDVTPGARPPIDQLRGIVRHVLHVLVENRDLARLVLREAVGLDADFDRKLQDFYGRILEVIRHALETGHKVGLARKVNTTVTSFCILGSVKEMAYHLLVTQDVGELIDLDAVTREVLDFNVHGIIVPLDQGPRRG